MIDTIAAANEHIGVAKTADDCMAVTWVEAVDDQLEVANDQVATAM